MSRPTNTRNDRSDTATDPPARRNPWPWGPLALPLAFIAALVVANALTGPEEADPDFVVPPFSLVTTDGAVVTREDVLGEGDTLFYFSMGVGCDGCFARPVAVERAVDVERPDMPLCGGRPARDDGSRFPTRDRHRFGLISSRAKGTALIRLRFSTREKPGTVCASASSHRGKKRKSWSKRCGQRRISPKHSLPVAEGIAEHEYPKRHR